MALTDPKPIEAMASAIYDRYNTAYHHGTLASWADARDCHRNIALDAARAGHTALVKADDS